MKKSTFLIRFIKTESMENASRYFCTTMILCSEIRAAKKRVMGIEPTYPAWKAGVLPLNYTRRMIGVTGFEPATSWSQTRRSSQAEPHPDISFFPRPCGFVFLSYLPQRQDILYGMFLRKSTGFLKFFYFFATVFLPVFSQEECANCFFCFSFLIIRTIIDIFAQNSIFRPHRLP